MGRLNNLFLQGKDEIFLCSLANFDAYVVTRIHKSPKPYVFAVKSTDNLSFFENSADYVHVFCCSEKDGKKWLENVLLARVSDDSSPFKSKLSLDFSLVLLYSSGTKHGPGRKYLKFGWSTRQDYFVFHNYPQGNTHCTTAACKCFRTYSNGNAHTNVHI